MTLAVATEHPIPPDLNEAIPLPLAVREAQGKLTYKQLWRLIRRGEMQATQPAGKTGHYRVRRGDVHALLEPVQFREKR